MKFSQTLTAATLLVMHLLILGSMLQQLQQQALWLDHALALLQTWLSEQFLTLPILLLIALKPIPLSLRLLFLSFLIWEPQNQTMKTARSFAARILPLQIAKKSQTANNATRGIANDTLVRS